MFTYTFTGHETRDLLKDKTILVFGDSNMRALYKDLVWLINEGTLIPNEKLRDKNEPTFSGDVRVSRGVLHPGTNYVEVREYNHNPTIKFQFITRLFLDGFRFQIEDCTDQPPDVVVIGSCVWDLSRWGPSGVQDYKENLYKTFSFLKEKFLEKTRIIWTTALPPTAECKGGFLSREIEFLREALPFQVLEGNVYAAKIAKKYKIDVIDFHYLFKYMYEGHTSDGIHWDPKYVRYATNLLLTHLDKCWDQKGNNGKIRCNNSYKKQKKRGANDNNSHSFLLEHY